MKASEWAPLLPDGRTATSLHARERFIVQAVADGHYVHEWHSFEIIEDGHHIVVTVSRDTLRVGEAGDSIRVSVSAGAQQRIAEVLGASLLTPKLVDLIYRRALIKAPPEPRDWWDDGTMAWTSRMLEYSDALDALLQAGPDDLVASPAKDWVRINPVLLPAGRAANYGFLGGGPSRSVTGLPCWQQAWTAHGPDHVDYSQLARFALRQCFVDQEAIPTIDELLSGPLARIIAHDGPHTGDQR